MRTRVTPINEVERQTAWIAATLIVLAGCRADHDLERAMHDIPCRAVAGRIFGASYAAPHTSPSDAARKISLRVCTSKQPDEVRARAALWGGNAGVAKHLFERVTSHGHATAAAWSDYSAALYANAAPDDAFQFATALAAADHALDLDPNLAEALFNRALALDALSLRTAAVNAYKKYLQVEESSPWRLEAQLRIEKLESSARNVEKARKALERVAQSDDELFINDTAIAFPEETRQRVMQFLRVWAERVLARDVLGAASMLRRCRIIGRTLATQSGDYFVADTVQAIDRAADPIELAKAHIVYARSVAFDGEAARIFEANGSPMAIAIRPRMAIAFIGTKRTAPRVRFAGQASKRYPVLHAKMQWWDALFASRSGNEDTALKLYRSASAVLSAFGEKGSAARALELESSLRAAAGRTDEAWRLRRISLVMAAEADDDSSAAFTLYGAARDAIAAGQWNVAHALLNAMLTPAHGSERVRGDALAWRAFSAQRAGMIRTAAAELLAAHQAERDWDDLLLVEALLAKTPTAALTLLREPLNAAKRRSDERAIIQLLFERARLLRAAGQPSRAHDDLEQAVALLRRNTLRTPNTMIRDAVLGPPDTAYRLLADSLDAQGQTVQALDALELSPSSPGAHESLPPRTLLITYGIFDDRLAIYTRNSLGLNRTAVSIKRSQVEALVSAFNQAIAHDDQRGFQHTTHSLEQILVAPIVREIATGDTLVFVRDPALGDLPFGALMSRDKQYLIQDHPVVVISNASAYFRASHTRTATSRALLSVGNPLSGERRDGELASLTAAESEAEEIAAMYPSCALLVEGDATKKRVLGALPYCDAAHFAVHANAGLGDMMPPHLILTPTASDEGTLTAPEIAELHLDGLRTVMLAGCRTALSSQGSSDSLVNAFLAAGAGSVIGTLWEVEDASTREMSLLFHRELRKGSTPAEALRATQLEMIRRNAPPSVWASLQLYGSGK